MTITYLKGDATVPQASGARIIGHICNDIGGWGAGFVLAISKRWPEPERAYRAWHRDRVNNDFGLGAVQFVNVNVNADMWVANMIGQRDIRHSADGPPIRYDAVAVCLAAVAAKAGELQASVHLPRIGCGLAGGTWDRIEPLIHAELVAKAVRVHVYDFI